MALKKLINTYDKVDAHKPIRPSTILIIVLAAILLGSFLDASYTQLPSFFHQINVTANAQHILTDGTYKYYVTPYTLELNTTDLTSKYTDNVIRHEPKK